MITKTPPRDVLKIVVWLTFGLFAYIAMTKIMPPLVNLALNPQIAPVCSTFQAIYGLRTHIVAFGAAPDIRRRSTLLKKDSSGYHLWATRRGNIGFRD